MAMTQLSNEDDRIKDLARLGFTFGLGMIIGPPLGEIVSTKYG